MLKILAVVFSLFGAADAQAAAAVTNTTLTGAPIGAGYRATNGQLFLSTSASLQATRLPFSISFDALTPTYVSGAGNWFIRGGESPTASAPLPEGFAVLMNAQTVLDSAARVQAILHPSFQAGICDDTSSGAVCTRGVPSPAVGPLLDGKRHHFCVVWTPTRGTFYLDGRLVDRTTNVGTFTMGSQIWRLGTGFPDMTLWDMRIYSKALTADDCVNINRLQQADLIPNSGTLNADLIASLPLNNCVTTGPLVTCADASGNGNNATNDKGPPVVAILTPAGPVNPATGTISVTASCTDPSPGLSCTQVCYLIDGGAFSPTCPTTAPYTFSLDTTKIVDGVHQLSAIGFNATGIQGASANVALTTSNSVAATTYSFDGTNGSDSNTCIGTGPSQACKTLAKLQTLTLKGGDTVQFKVGTPFPTTAGYTLCAGASAVVGPPAICATQNFYPSSGTLTFTTYGGGTCNPFALVTTNCATLTLSSGGASVIEAFNPTNVVFENLALTGNQTSMNQFCGATSLAGAGIQIESSLAAKNIVIQNNYLKDFGCHIVTNGVGTEVGIISNITVTDNVTFNTALANPGGYNGIRFNNNTSGHIFGNLVYQIGGTASQNQGNCIVVANANGTGPGPLAQTIVEFNVGHDFSGNNVAGGGICMYTFNSFNTLWQFNESYNGLPYTGAVQNGMYDFDGFDMDFSTNTAIQQFNYAHNNPVQNGFTFCMHQNSGALPWANNQTRYNIAENNFEGMSWCAGVTGTNSFVYNNTVYANLAAYPPPFNPVSGVLAGSCTTGPTSSDYDIVFANNLCIHDGPNTGAVWGSTGPAAKGYVARNNDYWEVNSVPLAYSWLGVTYASVAALQAAVPTAEVGSVTVNPLMAGSLPAGTCWAGGSSPPTGPQPCPAAYQLTHGSPLIGVGLDINATYGISVSTRDYFGNLLSNNHVGTGFNIGADGAPHP